MQYAFECIIIIIITVLSCYNCNCFCTIMLNKSLMRNIILYYVVNVALEGWAWPENEGSTSCFVGTSALPLVT